MHVDANILIRFLTGSPEDQALKVRGRVSKALEDGMPLTVAPMIVAEAVWVLLGRGFERGVIREALKGVLLSDAFTCEESAAVLAALDDMADRNVDWVDAYLAHHSLRCPADASAEVLSFDKDLDRFDEIRRVQP